MDKCGDCMRLSECTYEFGAKADDPSCTGFREPLRIPHPEGPTMTDKTELEVTQVDDGKEYVIRKGGYFYRPKAEGYTSNVNEAGRFSLSQAILHSFPNGPDGPRDGITYELATRAPDPTPAVHADGLVEAAEMARVILMGVRPGLCMKPGGKVVSAGQALVALEAALAAYRGEA